ncbi:MAG: CHAT domain-containing protein [Terriglobales bacterium]
MVAATNLKSSDGQQAQNELDHLARYGLIRRIKNEGNVAVDDRSRWLYLKDENVRAHRGEILRYADNPGEAKEVPTKRRPQGSTTVAVTRHFLKKRKHLDVLYLTANPRGDLRVEAEVHRVQQEVRGSKLRDNIDVHYQPAADLDSLIQGLNDHVPAIVHFSGHGNESGVGTDDAKSAHPAGKLVSFELLAKAIAATDTPPQIIVLNSCKSAGAKKSFFPPAKAIVAMGDSIGDLAAIAFAAKFYAAIAAGQSLHSAFAQGKVAVEAASIDEADTPELLLAQNVNPKKIFLT